MTIEKLIAHYGWCENTLHLIAARGFSAQGQHGPDQFFALTTVSLKAHLAATHQIHDFILSLCLPEVLEKLKTHGTMARNEKGWVMHLDEFDGAERERMAADLQEYLDDDIEQIQNLIDHLEDDTIQRNVLMHKATQRIQDAYAKLGLTE